jgi:hypothetical protein
MRIILAALIGSICAVHAQAQSFGSSTFTPINGAFNGPSPTGAPLATDLVLINRLVGNSFSTTGLSLGSFASASDVQTLNSRINGLNDRVDGVSARIDEAFQQLKFQQDRDNSQLSRGVAAAVALPGAFMPSAPGRTTWGVNAATFNSQFGAGFTLTHRLDVRVPLAVTAAFGNGGGAVNVARVGLMGEF